MEPQPLSLPPAELLSQTDEERNETLWQQILEILHVQPSPELAAKVQEIHAIPATPRPEDDQAAPLVGEFIDIAQRLADESKSADANLAFQIQVAEMYRVTGRIVMHHEALYDVVDNLDQQGRRDIIALLAQMKYTSPLPPGLQKLLTG